MSMRPALRKFLSALGKGLILIVALSSMNCCGYLAKQGYFVAKYSFKAKDIETLLDGSGLGIGERKFLERVLDIRKFAVEKIGLARNGNYTSYVKIDKKYLIDVVAAAHADTFDQYKWCFPLVGCVPYKGFFERKDAVREAGRLRRKGYDVTIGSVDAFSSLGFLKDPIYSFMLRLSVYDLASLIIHEQTHATIFLKNRIEFNEETATFVGDEGALLYIRTRFGDTSAVYRDALLEKQDYEAWQRELETLYQTLTSVYATSSPREEKLRRKREAIEAFKKQLSTDYDDLFKTDRFKGIEKADINNAYLAIRMTYTKDLSLFYKLYLKNRNDLAATVGQLKSLKKVKGKDPKQHIRTVLLAR